MKKLLFTLVLVLPLAAIAQKLEGFWGLEFANTTGKVQDIIKQRTGKLPIEGSNENVLAYRNCDFAGNKAYLLQLFFFNDRLYGGDITITPGNNESMDVYNQIVDNINHKYQQGVSGSDQVIATYTPGKVTWTFATSMSEITASMESGVIRISYRDGYISGQKTAALEGTYRKDY